MATTAVSILLGCDTVPLGIQFPCFETTTLYWKISTRTPTDATSYPRRMDSSSPLHQQPTNSHAQWSVSIKSVMY